MKVPEFSFAGFVFSGRYVGKDRRVGDEVERELWRILDEWDKPVRLRPKEEGKMDWHTVVYAVLGGVIAFFVYLLKSLHKRISEGLVTPAFKRTMEQTARNSMVSTRDISDVKSTVSTEVRYFKQRDEDRRKTLEGHALRLGTIETVLPRIERKLDEETKELKSHLAEQDRKLDGLAAGQEAMLSEERTNRLSDSVISKLAKALQDRERQER